MEKVGRSFVDKVLEFFYGESTSVRMQLFLDVGDLGKLDLLKSKCTNKP